MRAKSTLFFFIIALGHWVLGDDCAYEIQLVGSGVNAPVLKCKESTYEQIRAGIQKYKNDVTHMFLRYANFTDGILKRELFYGVTKLEGLYIAHTNIHTLEDNVFAEMYNLRDLHLYENEIRHIGVNTFAGLQNLEYLTINDNRIGKFDCKALNQLPKIRLLGLHNNRLRNYQCSSGSLYYLSLYGNKIRHLDADRLKRDNPNLSFILIDDNQFTCNDLRKLLNRLQANHIKIDEHPATLPEDNEHTNRIDGIKCI